MTKVLDCVFASGANQTIVSGDATTFGDGTGYIEVVRSGPALCYVSVTGNASLIDRIEFDSTSGGDTSNYGYYDSNNSWVSLTSTNTLTSTSTGSVYHIVLAYNNFPTTISTFLIACGSNQSTFSNLRIYDNNGNVLNMDIVTPSSSAKIGTSAISKCYLGNTEISKVYIGENVLYEKPNSSSSGNSSSETGGLGDGGWL